MESKASLQHTASIGLRLCSRYTYGNISRGEVYLREFGMERLARWLEDLGLDEHFEAFRTNDIDFDILLHVTDDELEEIGLSIGHRRRLLVGWSLQGT